jgi:glutaredoxin
MRARCERHGLALGPGGCLLCRREQGPDAAAEAALAAAASAAPTAASAAPTAASAAPEAAAAAAGAPATTPLPDPPHAAPALVTDFPPPRQLSIQIPRSVLVLPAAGLALYLLASLFLRSEPALDAAAKNQIIAAKESRAASAAADAPEEADGADDGAADGENAVVEPVSPAELARLRERTREAQRLSEARERVKVTLFYTERCPHCSEARAYLTAHGVRAEQYDIDKDAKARARYLRLNPKGSLPTLVVEKRVLAGFDADRFERALDRAARARLAPAHKRRRH